MSLALLFHALPTRRAVIGALVMVTLFGASFLPFLSDGAAFAHVYENVITYRAYAYGYGLTDALPPNVLSSLFHGLMIVTLILTRRASLPMALDRLALVYLVFAPGISSAHMTAVTVLWMLTAPRRALLVAIPISALIFGELLIGWSAVYPVLNVVWVIAAAELARVIWSGVRK